MDDQVVGQNRGVEISVAHCTMYIKRGVFFLHHKILIYIYDKGHIFREYQIWFKSREFFVTLQTPRTSSICLELKLERPMDLAKPFSTNFSIAK